MEFAEGGDLMRVINQNLKARTKIKEAEIWKAVVDITRGLKSLHDKKILHRDLKAANIFIGGQGTFKLGDLNVSKVLKKGLAYTQTGTPYYASP
jgi:NIMA (never in mitosis gene a)-related kinase 1/4/5